MSEFHYLPTPTDAYKPGNMKGITVPVPPQTRASGSKEIRDGKALINANAPGMMNENRFTSLKPSKQSK